MSELSKEQREELLREIVRLSEKLKLYDDTPKYVVVRNLELRDAILKEYGEANT